MRIEIFQKIQINTQATCEMDGIQAKTNLKSSVVAIPLLYKNLAGQEKAPAHT